MDYGTLRGIVTLVLLIVFIGIIAWAYSSRRKKAFDEAANSIFADDKAKDERKQESNNE
ncbi:cbb3-type cytochrome c oxidase subunit 3 [Gallaecimonas sp. GXIMD4217]|uniref:cbb3-type cytochrome oxidase subunit 3 n=1 Tax=Gallaecimonas sp. GXIMD4217 TaxID=3131927 RepID=UPI00311ACC8B